MVKSSRLFPIIVALFFFLMMRPVFTWSWNPLIVTVLTVLLMTAMLTQTSFRCKGDTELFIFFFLLFLLYVFNSGTNIIGSIPILLLSFIPFTKASFIQNTYLYFEKIVVLLTSISIVIWIVVVVLGIGLPYVITPPLIELKDYDYFHYPFLVVPQINVYSINTFFRFHCIFDEPGVVGTYSLMMLYLNDFNLSKFKNVVLLIAGILSFSLFFFISFSLFIIIKVFSSKKINKYKVIIIAVFAVFFILIQNVTFLNEMIGQRLEYDEDKGTIAGNNRSTEDLSDYIASIRGTSTYFFGDTKEKQLEYAESASMNNAILKYGMFFIVAYFLFFFLFANNKIKGGIKEVVLFMLFLFLTLYQRPGFINPYYLFIFVCVVYSRVESKEELAVISNNTSGLN